MAEIGDFISKDDLQLIKNKMNHVQEQALEIFHKNLKVISYITYLLEKAGIKPVIVGGHAVEIYTLGQYTTVDVDLVLSGRELAGKVLEQLGFEKNRGHRHWYHEELGLPIEIPDDILAGSMNQVIQLTVEEGFHVYVIGIEDLILDRVRAAVYWNSSGDREWALLLLNTQYEEIDFAYLEQEAKKEPDRRIEQLVTKFRKQAELFLKE